MNKRKRDAYELYSYMVDGQFLPTASYNSIVELRELCNCSLPTIWYLHLKSSVSSTTQVVSSPSFYHQDNSRGSIQNLLEQFCQPRKSECPCFCSKFAAALHFYLTLCRLFSFSLLCFVYISSRFQFFAILCGSVNRLSGSLSRDIGFETAWFDLANLGINRFWNWIFSWDFVMPSSPAFEDFPSWKRFGQSEKLWVIFKFNTIISSFHKFR